MNPVAESVTARFNTHVGFNGATRRFFMFRTSQHCRFKSRGERQRCLETHHWSTILSSVDSGSRKSVLFSPLNWNLFLTKSFIFLRCRYFLNYQNGWRCSCWWKPIQRHGQTFQRRHYQGSSQRKTFYLILNLDLKKNQYNSLNGSSWVDYYYSCFCMPCYNIRRGTGPVA